MRAETWGLVHTDQLRSIAPLIITHLADALSKSTYKRGAKAIRQRADDMIKDGKFAPKLQAFIAKLTSTFNKKGNR